MKPSRIVAAIFLCAAACGSTSSKSGAGSSSPSGSAAANVGSGSNAAVTASATSLDGNWHVVSVGDDQGKLLATVGDKKTTLNFAKGHVSGSAGCNNIHGTMTQTDSTVAWRNVGITEMACPDKAIMQQEGAYWRAINASATFKIVDGTLEFRNQAGTVSLTAVKAP